MSFRLFSAALWFISVLFILYIVVAAIKGDISDVPLVGRMLTAPHGAERVTPIIILLFFVWVLCELAVRKWQVDRENSATAVFAKELSAAPEHLSQMPSNDAKVPRGLRRLHLLMDCRRRGETSSLHEGLPAAAALDAGALNARYVPLYVYAWILPVLGFIGTATGMATAIGGFKEALLPGATQLETQALAQRLSQDVIPGLSTAFETTILALAAALVAYLCTTALRSLDQDILARLDRYCVTLLLRIPQPLQRDDKNILAALSEVSEQLRNLAQLPITLERAAGAIDAAAEALASASNETGSAASASRVAAEALATASKEVHESALADYQFTMKRIPRA
jgi:biopolymer transport protein ExbB/TolQ